MKIEIEVIGAFCNTWPNLIVEINNKKIHDAPVEGHQKIMLEFNDCIANNNVFVIGMNNKKFGLNKIWDTKIKNNKIVEDKTIEVLSVMLDGVECKMLFKNEFYVWRVEKQPTYFPDKVKSNGMMNYNGYFTFNFDLPLYNSLINKKYKVPFSDEFSYFSNYTKVFHYDEEKEIINSIKNILDEIDEKFSDKRSKIRNS